MKSKAFLVSFFTTCFYFSSFSQTCDCDKVLQYGIYNVVRQTSKSNEYKQEIRSSCNQLDRAIKQSEGGDGGVSFAGFGLSGNYTHEQLSSIKKLYCQNQSIVISNNQDERYFSQIVAPEALDAYLKCKSLCASKNIQLQITPTDENFRVVEISLTGNFRDPSLAPQILHAHVDSSIFLMRNSDLYEAHIRNSIGIIHCF